MTRTEASRPNTPPGGKLIYFGEPCRWWVGGRADVAWLRDPDDWEVPSRSRHLEAPYDVIAEVIGRLSSLICAAEDDTDLWLALTGNDVDRLGDKGLGIVEAWYWNYPIADHWAAGPTDGAHRLWSAWRAIPSALLPVRSSHLEDMQAFTSEWPHLLDKYRQETATVIAQHVVGTKIARRSPRFVAALDRFVETGSDAPSPE